MPRDSYLSEAARAASESIDRSINDPAVSAESRRAFEECRTALSYCTSIDDVRYVRTIFHDVKLITLFGDVHATTSRVAARCSKITRR